MNVIAKQARQATDRMIYTVFTVSFAALVIIMFLDQVAGPVPAGDVLLSLAKIAFTVAVSVALIAHATASSHRGVQSAETTIAKAVRAETDGIVVELGRVRMVEREMDTVMGRVVQRLGRVDTMERELRTLGEQVVELRQALSSEAAADRAATADELAQLGDTLTKVIDQARWQGYAAGVADASPGLDAQVVQLRPRS